MFVGKNIAIESIKEWELTSYEADCKIVGVGKNVSGNAFCFQSLLQLDHRINLHKDISEAVSKFASCTRESSHGTGLIEELITVDLAAFVTQEQRRSH